MKIIKLIKSSRLAMYSRFELRNVIIILKIEVSQDSHWEFQFSNPKTCFKSEENDPAPLPEGWLWVCKCAYDDDHDDGDDDDDDDDDVDDCVNDKLRALLLSCRFRSLRRHFYLLCYKIYYMFCF